MKFFNKGRCKKIGNYTINSGVNDLVESDVLVNYIKRDDDLSMTMPVVEKKVEPVVMDKKVEPVIQNKNKKKLKRRG